MLKAIIFSDTDDTDNTDFFAGQIKTLLFPALQFAWRRSKGVKSALSSFNFHWVR